MSQYFSRGHVRFIRVEVEAGERNTREISVRMGRAHLIIRRLITRLVAAVCLRPRRWKAFVASGSRPRTAAVEEGTIRGCGNDEPFSGERGRVTSFVSWNEKSSGTIQGFGVGAGRIFPPRLGTNKSAAKLRGGREVGAVTRIFLLGRDEFREQEKMRGGDVVI